MIFSKKKKKVQLAKIPEIWLLHLPAKVIFVSKNWEMGERAGRWQSRVVVGSPIGDAVCGREPWLASLRRSHFLARLREGQVEPRRKCCAVGLPPDTQRTTEERHSVDTPPPHSTQTHPLTDWLAFVLAGQRVSETADIASLAPPNRTRLNIWSNSDIHFDIVQRRKKKIMDCSFPQRPTVHFSFVSLHPATRGTTPHIFPRNRYST